MGNAALIEIAIEGPGLQLAAREACLHASTNETDACGGSASSPMGVKSRR